MKHVVKTDHIKYLIRSASNLVDIANKKHAGTPIQLDSTLFEDRRGESWTEVEDLLLKAAADLRHAADELNAERLSCYGWKQS